MPVNKFPTMRASELDMFITGDGVKYMLSSPPDRVVLSEEGTGMPPIQYVTQRGPYQNGETLRDMFLQPRIVQLIVRHSYCDRQKYWDGRAALLDILRPNRAGGNPETGVLRKVLPNGTKRDLCCVIQQGPNFAPRQVGVGGGNVWDEWSYTETLRFEAFNPVYFDPTAQIVALALADIGTFPMTFPVTFVGFSLSTVIVYAGTWDEYPTITIDGPLSQVVITNVTTGEHIGINYALPDGRSIIIGLGPGLKTVALDDGTQLIGAVTSDSDLATFHFTPGNNTITVTGSDTGTATRIVFSYFNRYIGI